MLTNAIKYHPVEELLTTSVIYFVLSEELIIWVNITIDIIKKTKRMEVTFIYRKKLIIKKIIPRTTVTIAPSTNKSFHV